MRHRGAAPKRDAVHGSDGASSAAVTRSTSRRSGRTRASLNLGDDGAVPDAEAVGEDSVSEDGGEEYYPQRFHGCFSSQAVGEVISMFGECKKSILCNVGLDGLVHLKSVQNHSRSLVFWLLKRLDTNTMMLDLGGGRLVPLTEDSVGRCLGIRSTGIELEETDALVPAVLAKLHKEFKTKGPRCLPSLFEVKSVLLKDYGDGMSPEETDRFVVALAAFCCGHMFGPVDRTAVIPKNVWGFIADPKNVRGCNWSKYVLSVIKSVAKQVQSDILGHPTSVKLGGCWLYLEVHTVTICT